MNRTKIDAGVLAALTRAAELNGLYGLRVGIESDAQQRRRLELVVVQKGTRHPLGRLLEEPDGLWSAHSAHPSGFCEGVGVAPSIEAAMYLVLGHQVAGSSSPLTAGGAPLPKPADA